MPRGGARPGAGRKPSKPRAEKAPKLDKDGFKTDESWPFGQIRPEESAVPPPAPDLSNLSPLDYLLEVMRDPLEEKPRRLHAASLAAPYCHAKKGEGGKKDEKNEAAKRVASRFAPAAPPKLVAAGGKKV